MFKLSAYLVLLSFFGQVECSGYRKDSNTLSEAMGIQLRQISKEEYPKAFSYFEGLRTKYPSALSDVNIAMASVGVPAAESSTIVVPSSFVESLEKEIEPVKIGMEWAALHEAGHIHHSHLAKLRLFNQILPIGASAYFVYLIYNDFDLRKIGATYLVVAILGRIAPPLLLKHLFEPQADDFANKLCDSPEAFLEAAKDFNHAMEQNYPCDEHPSHESRIEKINKAMIKKFGYGIPLNDNKK